MSFTGLLCLSWSSAVQAQVPEVEVKPAYSMNQANASDRIPEFLPEILLAKPNADTSYSREWATPQPGKSEHNNAAISIAENSVNLIAQTPTIPPGTLEPDRPDLAPLPNTLPTPTPTPPLTTPEQLPSQPEAPSGETVKVERVEVLGSTVFSKQELDKVIEPFIGKELTFEQLLEIRTVITNFYTSKGYTTSGAFLPPQDISSGIIKIQVVEGEIEKIEIQGLRRLRESYVRSRINLVSKPPINIRRLEQALQLLQLDPLFTRVQADLKAGTSPGQSILTLNLQEADHFHFAYLVENRDSPSVGSIRNSGILTHNNLLGFGDRFNVEAGFTEGVKSYDFGYEFPVNARNGTVNFRYAQSYQTVIEEPFSVLDLNSESRTISLGFRQPIIRTPNTEFALGLSADLRRSQTFLLKDIPFSFSVGPENGESKVSVLRFSQDWTKRTPTRVLAARSQFSFGLDALGATVNDTGVDGRFFSWVGQFQVVQSLGSDIVSIGRIATQLTGDSLLSLEQFSIGGVDTVRGYRQNQRVGDSGITGSLEVRIPVVKKPESFGVIQLTPFFDFGRVWNSNGEAIDTNTLASVGLGLRWQKDPYFSARLDWGVPLIGVEQSGNSLQDSGIFFSIRIQPF